MRVAVSYVLNLVRKLRMCDAQVSRNVKLPVSAKTLDNVCKLLVVRGGTAAVLSKLSDIAKSATPSCVHVRQLQLEDMRRVTRRVIRQGIFRNNRWPFAQQPPKQLDLGLNRLIRRSIRRGDPVNAQDVSAREIITALPTRELPNIL